MLRLDRKAIHMYVKFIFDSFQVYSDATINVLIELKKLKIFITNFRKWIGKLVRNLKNIKFEIKI